MVVERSGRSRRLREILKERREEKGWSLQRVADKIARDLDRKSLSGEAVRQWESFETHPSVDKFAAWARVLGMQLVVDLIEADSSRGVAMLKAPTIEMARAFEMASMTDQRMILAFMERMGILN